MAVPARRLTVIAGAMMAAALMAPSALLAELELGTPHTIAAIRLGPPAPEAPSGCGLRADYAFPGHDIRVEFVRKPGAGGSDLTLRAFSPTTVGMYITDVWLTTASFTSLDLLQRARVNSVGVLEAKGRDNGAAGAEMLRELANSGGTVELFTDSTLPAARVALSLPGPVPAVVLDQLAACDRDLSAVKP